MDVPTRRGRLSISLSSPSSYPSVQQGATIPSDLLLSLLLSKSLVAIALHTVKVWLLSAGLPPAIFNAGFLLVGAICQLVSGSGGSNSNPSNAMTDSSPVKDKQRRPTLRWINITTYGFGVCLEYIAFWTAIHHLGVAKVLMLSQYAAYWCPNLLSRKALNLTSALRNALVLTLLVFGVFWMADSKFLPKGVATMGYTSLVLHILLHTRHHNLIQQSPNASRLKSIGLLVAVVCSIPLALYSFITLDVSALAVEQMSTIFPLTLLAALTTFMLDPFVDRAIASHIPRQRQISNGWLCASLSAWFVGLVAFEARWSWLDIGLLVLARWVINAIVASIAHTFPNNTASFIGGTLVSYNMAAAQQEGTKQQQLNFIESFAEMYRAIQNVIKIILRNNDSRRIFYFLCLNFSYMGIQMACVSVQFACLVYKRH